MPLPDLGTIALVAIAALLLMGALAPLETLGWWAGWYGDPIDEARLVPEHASDDEDDHDDPGVSHPRPEVDPWVVFLTGVHAVAEQSWARSEVELLHGLRAALPEGVVVEIFPYSVTNRALTADRAFAWLWRRALGWKLSHRRLAQLVGFIINLRNLWQVLVSADRRYGPMYNRGTAELIVRSLRRRGLPTDRGGRIVLIGYSGGAQIAAGAAPFVKERTGAEITVVSLGGMISADPGLLASDHTLHLYGRRDRMQRLVALFFPGRWRALRWSAWNQARARGTLQELAISPCDHTGAAGYLDQAARVDDGRSYFEVTLAVLAAAARDPRGPLPIALASPRTETSR
jgi:hypothetical protein